MTNKCYVIKHKEYEYYCDNNIPIDISILGSRNNINSINAFDNYLDAETYMKENNLHGEVEEINCELYELSLHFYSENIKRNLTGSNLDFFNNLLKGK